MQESQLWNETLTFASKQRLVNSTGGGGFYFGFFVFFFTVFILSSHHKSRCYRSSGAKNYNPACRRRKTKGNCGYQGPPLRLFREPLQRERKGWPRGHQRDRFAQRWTRRIVFHALLFSTLRRESSEVKPAFIRVLSKYQSTSLVWCHFPLNVGNEAWPFL